MFTGLDNEATCPMQRLTKVPVWWISAELPDFELWSEHSRSVLAEPSGIALVSYLSGFFTLLQLLKEYVGTYIVDSLLFSHGPQRRLVR